MAGFVECLAHRFLALDQECLATGHGWQPFAIGQIHEPIALTLDLLEEHILVVAHDHGHAPRDLAVEASDDGRHTGDGHAGSLEFGRADLHVVPG